VDEHGARCAVGSADVNDYVRGVCGEAFTAKDFRTWAGTVLVARALADAEPAVTGAAGKRAIVRAIETAAQRLGNTVAVCRKSYVHPAVVEGFLEGDVIATAPAFAKATAGKRRPASRGHRLTGDEAAVARLIERRTRINRKPAKKVA
jgi:DNA topoisomerase-1